jgi:hypothetical protein
MSSPDTGKAFLVLARMAILGGSTQSEVDVFRAYTPLEAETKARTLFSQAREDQAIVYGDRLIFPGVVASLVVECLGVVDLKDEYNAKWSGLIDLFDNMAGESEGDHGTTEQNRHLQYPPAD